MMKDFYFEWLHFTRNKARPIALLLFVFAGCFGLYNGYSMYSERLNQIDVIKEKMSETQNEALAWMEEGKQGPEGRAWVNINEPFWSMWYATHYVIDKPDEGLIYNLGQTEQFGYYKRVTMWTTAMDDDLSAEIANPEMVQMGALDFTFAWFYLMPLLLIILSYQLKGTEYDLGFLTLLKIQNASIKVWIAKRLSIIGLGLFLILSAFIFLPTALIKDISFGDSIFWLWLMYTAYLILWLLLFFVIIIYGKGQADQAFKMIGIWLLLTVLIPSGVNQYITIKKPADLMMSMITAKREGQKEVYDLSEEIVLEKAINAKPQLKNTRAVRSDSLLDSPLINEAYRLARNSLMDSVVNTILRDQIERNKIIESTYWFNPVSWFHNAINDLSKTGYKSNLAFRLRIQEAGNNINERLISDEWNYKVIDKNSFEEYVKLIPLLEKKE